MTTQVSSPQPAILIESLVKRFKGHLGIRTYTAVDGLSFAVETGGICGFLGPNGAGKTTTLKVLMDLIRPDAGRVEIFGQPPGERAVKARLGYLPETPYFYDQLSGRELLHYFAELHGVERNVFGKRSAELLEMVGMTRAADRRLRTYSKGMLQRIGMAQALIGDPELVVLDEPMTGLDPIGRSEFRAIILNLKARGKTVLFSSHILADAQALCDRVIIIHKSKLVAQGTVPELLRDTDAKVRVTINGLEPGNWHSPFALESRQPGSLSFLVADHAAGDALVRQAISAGGRVNGYEALLPDLETVFIRHVSGGEK